MVNGLKHRLEAEGDGLNTMRADLVHSLKTWYSEGESKQFYELSTLLDPRFKDTVFSSSEAAEIAKQLLLTEMCIVGHVTECETQMKIATDSTREADSVTSLCTSLIHKNNAQTSTTSSRVGPEQELQLYFSKNLSDNSSNPLQY
ncbi:hypothetical protein PR048_018552 [Dryococelus australis]|uniref:Uncharacterized protein n=1 Tax=Dryococelus australis TaxID=614101 RepID=A0ABQ9HCS5_9NEOP|nr:hypothetical protein PR048_018552 [Dryococelus australis]